MPGLQLSQTWLALALSSACVSFSGGHAVFQLILMLWLMSEGAANWFNVAPHSIVHRTVVFNVFIIVQIWNEFNARKLHGEFNVFSGMERSTGHLRVTVVMVLFQWCAVQV